PPEYQDGFLIVLIEASENEPAKKIGVGNKLYVIRGNKSLDPDGELSHNAIAYLKNTFTTIIKKNIGNTHEIEKSLKNLPYHVFDRHDHCGSFCGYHKDKENYDTSRHFKNEVLFNALKNLFDKLAQNAAEYSLAGSSQPNESLNNSMSSHCPKSRSYTGIKYSRSLLKHIKTTDSKATKRKHREEQPQQKAKRKVKVSQKKQLRMRKEHSEIETYTSNLALFGNSSTYMNSIIDSIITIPQIIEKSEANKKSMEIEKTLAPLKDVISKQMIKRLADNNILYEDLLQIYKDKGEKECIVYLRGEVDGQPSIIK
ncbi:hypothetical protein PV328_012198, partial [Microctonus aethiopoides]